MTLFHGVYSLFRVSSQKENFLFAPVTNFYIIVHVLYHEKYKNSLQAQIDAILIKSYVKMIGKTTATVVSLVSSSS